MKTLGEKTLSDIIDSTLNKWLGCEPPDDEWDSEIKDILAGLDRAGFTVLPKEDKQAEDAINYWIRQGITTRNPGESVVNWLKQSGFAIIRADQPRPSLKKRNVVEISTGDALYLVGFLATSSDYGRQVGERIKQSIIDAGKEQE